MRKPIITAILYKPNGSEFYRSYVVDRFNSDFQLIISENEEDIIDNVFFYLSKEFKNQEPKYEVSYMVDGFLVDYSDAHCFYYDEVPKTCNDIIATIKTKINMKFKELDDAEKVKKEELALLAKLKAKYEK